MVGHLGGILCDSPRDPVFLFKRIVMKIVAIAVAPATQLRACMKHTQTHTDAVGHLVVRGRRSFQVVG